MNPPDAFPRAEPLPAELADALAQAADRLGLFGPPVQWYAEVPSTSDLAAACAERGAREGSIVMADAQTAGRGRQRRSWSSPPGAGLYVSVVLRPDPRAVPLLTMAAGVAIADGIGAATGFLTALKWPNDVVVGPRKVAGILAETGASPDGVPHVVLGFGVNVRVAAYPPEVAARATSLERELGRVVDRGVVLAECMAALAARYDDLRRDRSRAIVDAWRAYARPLLSRPVEWDGRDGVHRGVAENVDDSGALIVRTSEGTVRVISGEVRWR
ncbi:MAG: biotin--[acetyl-CoA-carboxylase] ligase [Vicinamibacterales bacterium]